MRDKVKTTESTTKVKMPATTKGMKMMGLGMEEMVGTGLGMGMGRAMRSTTDRRRRRK
jgi:hypothetical protein